MVQVTAEEAQAHLPKLIAAAISGETILITQDGQQVAQLTRIAPSGDKRQFGSARGLIKMSDDFDEPLEEFKEYME